MLTRDILKKVRQIEIRTSRVVNDVFAGQYHSAFRGRGMEFEEVRHYQVGDDVRSIDWNVSARYGQPFVKVFREERELTVMLVVDVSPSGLFGSAGRFKLDLAAELGAVLAFSAIRSNDKVGLILFSDTIEKYVPARKGNRHVLRIIRELLSHAPTGRGTDIAGAMQFLNRVTRRKTVCLLLSDFQAAGYEASLRIARRRHDLVPVIVADPRERELPDVGLIEVHDPETGRRAAVDTSSRRVRREFAARVRRIEEDRATLLRRMKLDHVEVRTDRSYIEPLAAFFRRREARA
ncbi:MAG: DUF58 domain-containing protein [Phycisphaerae bacterium]|nr:MAG: DUF58 domain-containing protein [Planctomycetota bacterium]KAB2941287.1 MAG: DUF58 domain-containing protein [Phycisphaerae bacterium]MBE7458434.1 DUF58 domain-containing protein [Planctomycetia bacterium]MCK6464935.1 DUF58 domain-containing protein [Phycisphaerae bacterium]MCL4719176.1 DUF58 domain-containing protein [Phycisphaerae bacterium]